MSRHHRNRGLVMAALLYTSPCQASAWHLNDVSILLGLPEGCEPGEYDTADVAWTVRDAAIHSIHDLAETDAEALLKLGRAADAGLAALLPEFQPYRLRLDA